MIASQRTDGFVGGIQTGSVAYDVRSRTLNRMLTEGKNELELQSVGLDSISRLDHMAPDGGIWFRHGQAVAAFEGKKQGSKGNAHERWFKNHRFLTHKYPEIRYVTFICGEGAAAGNRMYEDFNRMLAIEGKTEWNKIHPTGCSFFANVDGFTKKELLAIMREAMQ